MEDKENTGPGPKGFSVPGDFFESSARRLAQKIEFERELDAYPLLKQNRSGEIFTLPQDYFSSGAVRLETIGFPLLHGLKKELPFAVPEGYFASAPGSNLAAAGKKNPFAVPHNYFENAQRRSFSVLEEKKHAKVIFLQTRVLGWTAAALFLLALGWWMYPLLSPEKDLDCGTIACVDRTEILNSRSLESLDETELQELVDPQSLERRLKSDSEKISPQNDTADLSEEIMDEL